MKPLLSSHADILVLSALFFSLSTFFSSLFAQTDFVPSHDSLAEIQNLSHPDIPDRSRPEIIQNDFKIIDLKNWKIISGGKQPQEEKSEKRKEYERYRLLSLSWRIV